MSKNTFIKVSSNWKRVKNIHVKISGTWRDVVNTYKKVNGVWEQTYLIQRELVISANTSNYNIFSAFGSPTEPSIFVVTVNSGVIIDSTSTSVASIVSGVFPIGSIVIIINNGDIIATGGRGGDGGDIVSCTNESGDVGNAGGDAIEANFDLIIDNTNGNIFGGGGGGGGGATSQLLAVGAAGGGGGGGAGDNGGGAGIGGTAAGCAGEMSNGFSGGVGTTVGGIGGQGGQTGTGNDAGDGGNGGGYGEDGNDGTLGLIGFGIIAVGGLAGKAIELNGNSITWEGGNNVAQVKGLVS